MRKPCLLFPIAALVLIGCSAPQPKTPDESERVPVNTDIPDELKDKFQSLDELKMIKSSLSDASAIKE